LSSEAFASWGWRIPLLASVVLVAVGVFIRRFVSESPEFTAAQGEQARTAERPKALAVLREQPGTVVKLALTWAAPGCLYYVTSVFAVSYMTNTAGFRRDVTFGILVVAHLVSIVFALLGGRVTDRLGRRTTMVIGLGALAVFYALLFPVIGSGNVLLIGVILAGALSSVLLMQAAQPALFAEAFPTRMRFTGASVAYTGANLAFAATAPFVAAGLLGLFGGNPLLITAYGLVIVVISAAALTFVPNRTVAPMAQQPA
jgi:MFS family permease